MRATLSHGATAPLHKPDTQSPVVTLKNVHLTLPSRAGDVSILKGVSLDVADGESLAIIGPSGSGKTSLLMIMAGLEKPTSGMVNVAGHDLTRMSEDELALMRGRHVGIVFQSFHLVPTMTAVENVALPLEFSGQPDTHKKAADLLKDVGLADRLDHYPAQLSGGEQQRVAVARALAGAPKLILADEPTGNLDSATGTQIVDLLFDLQSARNTTLVLVTHDANLAAKCDRVVHMGDGEIVMNRATAAA